MTTVVAHYFKCRMCKFSTILSLDPEKVASWRGGALIQTVFPELSIAERELMISGTCDSCFKNLFGSEDPAPVFIPTRLGLERLAKALELELDALNETVLESLAAAIRAELHERFLRGRA